MSEKINKYKLVKEWYMGVSPGNTSRLGTVLTSPIWDNIIEKAWIELENIDTDNMFVVKVIKNVKLSDESKNFMWYGLDFLVEQYKELEDIEEDSDDFFEEEEKIKIYKEFKKHCYEVLGEDYFK
jgi:hypothetical protein